MSAFSNDQSLSTRAMRRAASSESRALLRRLRNSTRGGLLVADENTTPMPPEPGKVCWSVELGSASLNWNTGQEEIEERVRGFELALDASGIPKKRHRHAARQMILQSMAANDHVRPNVGSAVVGATMWLAMTGEGGVLIAAGAVNHCGFLILAPDGGGKQFTFRMIAGWRDPVGKAANDNAPNYDGSQADEGTETS